MENEIIIHVEGMHGKSCRQKIFNKLSQIPGIELVQVDLADGRVGVTGGDLDHHQIMDSIESMGYTAFEY